MDFGVGLGCFMARNVRRAWIAEFSGTRIQKYGFFWHGNTSCSYYLSFSGLFTIHMKEVQDFILFLKQTPVYEK
jgi:hypothetical protein